MQGATFAAVPQLNLSANHQALANGTIAQAGNVGNALGTPLILTLLATGGFKAVIAMVVFLRFERLFISKILTLDILSLK